VSISSLCWQKLNDLGFDPQKPLVFLGAGEVISSLVKFFHDAGYTRLLFVNRTKERASELSAIYGGDALSIDEFWLYREKMHLLISCTGATEVILTAERFDQFFEAGVAPEFMVDLANPADIDEAISDRKYVRMIRLAEIQEVAVKNLQLRRDLMDQCIPIIELHERELQDELRVRRVEIAMSAVPESVKEIRRQALEKVFLKEFNQLDESSRELMLRMLDYMERKYISVPMKLAKEVLLTNIDVN
jgi:glutamyl-tRNA reductase